MDRRLPVFVYGTLKPGERLYHHIGYAVRDAVPATIPGRLFDTPFGYPILVDPWGEGCPLINGVLLYALEDLYEEMMRTIDVIEGEAGFVKGVMEVQLPGGEKVEAFVYYYSEPPPYARPFWGTEWP